ncbi:hypothetical protein J2Z79_003126 [Symbiobacterium terraclitae]|uniref:Uncharacterized protein n=1 Tax=Symbiobacterium terraclitae TaxID=557451 RepID=A0ABS4JZ12_9FIRM|nr:hypothetical protein [Symbiobacterium terraclitae]MBP2019684.1 hypothetical protein [Symbiobacterium terraclitae]
MLHSRLSGGSGLRLGRTLVDAKLMARSGLDEVNLRRARRAFRERWRRAPGAEKLRLVEGGTAARFAFVVDTLRSAWSPEVWGLWLRYLEHTEAEIDEMVAGEYPISPYMVRVSSALLGMKVDFLTAGCWPTGDHLGPDIDACPQFSVTNA